MGIEIKLDQLRAIDACDTLREHAIVFERLFGERAIVTREGLIKAVDAGLLPEWLIEPTLPADAAASFRARLGEARAEMEQAQAEADAEHHAGATTRPLPGGCAIGTWPDRSSEVRHAGKRAAAHAEFRRAVANALADALGLD